MIGWNANQNKRTGARQTERNVSQPKKRETIQKGNKRHEVPSRRRPGGVSPGSSPSLPSGGEAFTIYRFWLGLSLIGVRRLRRMVASICVGG